MSRNARTTELTELQRLIHDLRGTISRKDLQGNLLDQMKIVVLNDMERRLQQIRHLTARQKLKLAFIGPVGAGKTTLICDLLGLRVPEGEDGEVSFREVLTTSSGRTTACEVQILVRDHTRFDVHYHDEVDFNEMLEDFCLYQWKLAGKPLDEDFDNPASEVQKVIRNLVGLKQDAAPKLAQEYGDGQFRDFYADVLSRYRSQDRTRTELTYEGKPDDALRWVAAHFKKLNLGTMEGFSLPKSIQISVDKRLLGIPEDFCVDTIIDTKGLDNVGIPRKDIDDYVRGGEYLCVFVERFTDVPNSVSPVLAQHLTREAPDTAYRCLLLVNTREGESTAAINDDGDYVTEAEGHAIKTAQIKTILTGARVFNFLDANIRFHDPHRHFHCEKGRLSLQRGSNIGDVRANAGAVWNFIGDALLSQQQHLVDEVAQLKKRLTALEAESVLSASDQTALQLCHTTIKRISEDFKPSEGYLRTFARALGSYHVSTFRAINNRYGEYAGNNIYYVAGVESEAFFRITTEKNKSDIVNALQDLRAIVTGRGMKECLAQYIRKLDGDYQEAAAAARVNVTRMVEQAIHPQRANSLSGVEQFWQRVIGRWGQGPGYRDDVVGYYSFALASLQKDGAAAYKELWHQQVSAPLLENLYVPTS